MLMDLLAEKKKKKVQKVGLQGKKDVEVEMVASSSSSSASSSFCLSSLAPAAVTTPITIPTNPLCSNKFAERSENRGRVHQLE